MPLRPCLATPCPRLTAGTRCAIHHAEQQRARNRRRVHYQGDYQTRAAAVRDAANADPDTPCGICGNLKIEGDPWQAHHIFPTDPTSPLVAAHRSCNIRQSDTPPTATPGGTP